MSIIKKLLTCLTCFLLPTGLSFWVLNLLGHKVHHTARIGFSFIWIKNKLTLQNFTRIGHFNLVKINDLTIKKSGYLGKMNNIKGPFSILLKEGAAIGNRNSIYRAPLGVSYGEAILQVGVLSKITANHRIDCTRSITLGDYTILAGHDSQLWTHGYYHDKEGPGRFRLDGEIKIGDNVYVGSRCVITGDVEIVNTVVVGANSCVSKSLLLAGTYVNQPLRYIKSDESGDLRLKFKKIEGFEICEEVYERKA